MWNKSDQPEQNATYNASHIIYNGTDQAQALNVVAKAKLTAYFCGDLAPILALPYLLHEMLHVQQHFQHMRMLCTIQIL